MTERSLPVISQDDPAVVRRTRKEAAMPRRDFGLLVFGWVATLGSMLAATAAGMRGLLPNLLDEPDLRYRAGKPDEYADGAVAFLDEVRVFLTRRGNTFQAMSAVCTHLGCTVARDPGGSGFRCPCHGSVFDRDGRVLGGPAPQPLECYAVSQARDGRLVVDRGRVVAPDHYLVLDARTA